jgi:hypothetical protein
LTFAGLRRLAPLWIVAGVFAASRILLVLLGVHYDISLMPWLWQLADIQLLQHRLGETLWYLHSQPPVFNLVVGLVLKVAPAHVAGVFHIIFAALGLVLALVLLPLCRRLGLSTRASVALTCAISLAPFSLVYENWLYYEYPVMVFLVAAALLLDAFVRGGRIRTGFLFFSVLALVVYTRATFQIVWFVLVVAFLVSLRPDLRRPVLLAAAVPFLLVVGLYAKNAVIVGSPGTSSWVGMNLARITLWAAPKDELRREVARGKLSRLALVDPFSPLPRYRGLVRFDPPRGVPVLDRPMKANGGVNLDAIEYVHLSRLYLGQSLRYMADRPQGYARGIAKAGVHFSRPATVYSYVSSARAPIRGWDRVFNALVYWQTPWVGRIGFGLLAMYVFVTLWGLGLLRRAVRAVERTPAMVVVLFMWLTVVYVEMVSTLVDFGENERVHLVIDPLVLILTVLGILDLRGRRRPDEEETSPHRVRLPELVGR